MPAKTHNSAAAGREDDLGVAGFPRRSRQDLMRGKSDIVIMRRNRRDMLLAALLAQEKPHPDAEERAKPSELECDLGGGLYKIDLTYPPEVYFKGKDETTNAMPNSHRIVAGGVVDLRVSPSIFMQIYDRFHHTFQRDGEDWMISPYQGQYFTLVLLRDKAAIPMCVSSVTKWGGIATTFQAREVRIATGRPRKEYGEDLSIKFRVIRRREGIKCEWVSDDKRAKGHIFWRALVEW